MATRVHIIWSLVLLVFWAIAFGIFNKHFDGAHIERKKVAALERKLRLQAREVAKLESRFSEFKDAMVVAGVKLDKSLPWTDHKRSIASVISDLNTKPSVLWRPGSIAFDHAKKVFISESYRRAAYLLDSFVQQYPDHPSSPLAAFLLGESYFQVGNIHESVRALNLLITHYPETETACMGMLRLAKIFEKQERLEEALEVYELVKPQFPKSSCAEIASTSIKGLNL